LSTVSGPSRFPGFWKKQSETPPISPNAERRTPNAEDEDEDEDESREREKRVSDWQPTTEN
jgi:hypothetical protein